MIDVIIIDHEDLSGAYLSTRDMGPPYSNANDYPWTGRNEGLVHQRRRQVR